MTIRRALMLFAAIPVLMTLLLGASMYVLNRDLDKMREVPLVADIIESELDLLQSTANEYFTNGSGRAKWQTESAIKRIRALLWRAESTFTDEQDLAQVREIAARMGQAQWSFDEYSRMDGDINAVQAEYRAHVADRMRMEMRSLSPLANQLHRHAHELMREHTTQNFWMLITLLALIALMAVALMSPLLYRIGTGLRTLQRGIDEMTEGGLSRDLVLHGNDELASLAGRFNDMAHKLQTTEDEKAVYIRGLRTANHDLENFSYSVSHDLRAPLRAIDGFIAMLVEDHSDRLDDEGKRLFGIVQQNARKMGNLIDDILALSRAGRLELETAEVDMDMLVDEVWHELEARRGDRVIIFNHEPLPAVHCDPRAMRQVWQNLLENAIKFTRDREPARITVSGHVEHGLVRYTVSDNGAGFNPQYRDKLFTLFQRLHGMDEFEGTGVGLAISQRLITKHHGTISATAEVDRGASFSFTLPQSSPAAQAA